MPRAARLRQILVTATLVLVVLLLAGVTYQGVATAVERRRYPHPGRLLDVGGHQLHLHCTGEGSPAVVLEARGGGVSASWAWVQEELSRTTRVCSYDRAGLGWSETGDAPFDPDRVPRELHVLLEAGGVLPPIVLAGHALGGAYARLYAARYPGDVAALVLVDAMHPDAATAGAKAENDAFMLRLAPWAARTGLLRVAGALSHSPAGLPDPQHGAVLSFRNRPDHLTRSGAEHDGIGATMRLVREASMPADRPLLVLTPAEREPGQSADQFARMQELQESYLRLSSRSTLAAVPEATSAAMLSDPEAARFVAARIRVLVQNLRSNAHAPAGPNAFSPARVGAP